MSLDEAFLDVTKNKKGIISASIIEKQIRSEIYKNTGLTSSAGISINKLIAKIASDYNKPNGQKTVPPEYVSEFMDNLDVRKIHGIGEVPAQKMYKIGIFKGIDLKNKGDKRFPKSHLRTRVYHFHGIEKMLGMKNGGLIVENTAQNF